MTQDPLSRRAVLIGGTALLAASPLRALEHNPISGNRLSEEIVRKNKNLEQPSDAIGGKDAVGAETAIHVLKDPNCGCCSAWIGILENDGFAVTTEHSSGALLMRYKMDNGIPQEMVSCHTARVAGYMIEGHVPVADIRRLLDERPDAVGLAVPGMPYGSPGMGPESEREAYEVYLIHRDGSTQVFTRYSAA